MYCLHTLLRPTVLTHTAWLVTVVLVFVRQLRYQAHTDGGYRIAQVGTRARLL